MKTRDRGPLTAARSPRPKMTAQDARSFRGVSVASCAQIYAAIEERKKEGIHPDCQCEPYEDIFTFNRWLALAQPVKKGERALRIGSFAPIEDRGEGEGEGDPERTRLHSVTLCLFCRCQVQPPAA